ncbi:MAG: site-specific DNA-methyltransferase [Candidatus Tokpelaia sp.]|nr:MAG: site-specific DNA-methyltransferase [Candidatus Tokpelaia sp.]KAA6206765.1 MAG: site-specific DNA-methyltransferase [Candidatus Tokpelaia sp.]
MTQNQPYTLFQEDCRHGLPRLAADSIDFIVTDPPYFIDGMGDDWNDTKLKHKAAKAGIVGGLPVGMKFDREQGRRLQAFMQPLAAEFLRVLKPGGFCIVFSQGRLYHRVAQALDNAGFEIRDMLGWKYEGQAKAFSPNHFIRKDKSLLDSEKAKLIAELKGLKTPQLKPQIEPMSLAQKPREGTFVENWQKYGVGLLDTRESLDGRFPGNIMEVSKQGKNSDKIDHMTVKPVALIAHLIKLFTRPGQTVLDPFAGSGSHGAAALQTGRRFIGFEIEPRYCRFAEDRLQKYAGIETPAIAEKQRQSSATVKQNRTESFSEALFAA